MQRGDLRVVVRGEFTGTVLRVARVYPTLIELERESDGQWRSFASERPDEVERITREYGHCRECGENGPLVWVDAEGFPVGGVRGELYGSRMSDAVRRVCVGCAR